MSELGPIINDAMKAAELGVGAGYGVKAFGWAGNRLLGPVFDEFGLALKDRYSERRRRNFERIGHNAEKKAGDKLQTPGEVNPRVAMRIIEDGSWCDGPVMAEYFGGITAGSRTSDGSDDRGLSWANLVARLSTKDIHLHFLIHDAFRNLYLNTPDINLGLGEIRGKEFIYLPAVELLGALNRPIVAEEWGRSVVASLNTLVREGLLSDHYAVGDIDYLSSTHAIDAPDTGVVLGVSISGIELFLWAFNHGDQPMRSYLDPDVDFTTVEQLQSIDGARKLSDMKSERLERMARESDADRIA